MTTIKKLKSIICILTFCILLVSSCKNIEDDSIANTIETLTSAEYEGRFYDGEGNEKATSYLSERLKKYGYEPLSGDSLKIPFQADLPSISATSLVISGETDLVLNEGEHYVYSPMNPVIIHGTLTEQETYGHKTFVVESADGKSLTLKESDSRRGNYYKISSLKDSGAFELGLTPEAMEMVSDYIGNEVAFECKGEVKTFTLNNVVGVLPGKDRKRAVIVGAHFDHVGEVGNILYSGALDNASGTATLLEVAQLLSGKMPDMDIVFAFWNVEELGLMGSESLLLDLEEQYEELCYINLDCVGAKGDGDTLISSGNGIASESMCQKMEYLLKENGFMAAADLNEFMLSDHITFVNYGTINIGNSYEAIAPLIHIPADKMGVLDMENLEQLSVALAQVLENSAVDIFQASYEETIAEDSESGITLPDGNYMEMSSSEQSDYQKAIRDQLEYDEYYMLSLKAGRFRIISLEGEYFDSLEKAQQLYEGLSVKGEIGEYQLVQIQVNSNLVPADGLEEDGKVKKRLFSTDEILDVTLFYEYNEQYIIYQEFINQKAEDLLSSYGQVELVKGREDAWLVAVEAGEFPYYMFQQDENIVSVTLSPITVDEYGVYSRNVMFDTEFDEAEMLLLVEEIELEAPMISIGEK